jgi:hypothetical protein
MTPFHVTYGPDEQDPENPVPDVEVLAIDGDEFVHLVDGVEVERRPATAEELTFTQPPPPTAEQQIAELEAQLQALLDAINGAP